MGKKKNILFIINPISGGKEKANVPLLIDKYLNTSLFVPKIEFTNKAEHAFLLAEKAVTENADVVVAVGGDGTINEVASALEGTNVAMAIIPYGSGNGLARSLKISLNNIKALQTINNLNEVVIDTAQLANWKFFNMAGIGFDAHISYMFANIPKRGFKGYIKTTFSEIINYQSKNYEIEIDGTLIHREAFMISLANSSQYGNNAHISPTASLTDGLIDVCIVKPFPLHFFPSLVYRLFSKTAEKSRYVEIIKGRNIRIRTDKPEVIHLDGEPRQVSGDIIASIKPLSLKVLH